jgi:hypothetical protein
MDDMATGSEVVRELAKPALSAAAVLNLVQQ